MPIGIEKKRLLVCEGSADEQFFMHLMSERNLPEFQIEFPKAKGKPHGWQGFSDLLIGLSANRNFGDLSLIVVAADNDGQPYRSFQNIQGQVSSAGLAQPPQPRAIIETAGRPSVVILMLPWDDDPGSLETLCLPSIYRANPELRTCVEEYVRCAGANEWDNLSKKSKLQVQCCLSALCRSDPNTPLSHAWSRAETLVPLTDTCFDQVADFFSQFN